MTMHRPSHELEACVPNILEAPVDGGEIAMIVVRPEEDRREVIRSGALDTQLGLVGDNWKGRGNPYTEDGLADPEAQLTIMISRVIEAVAPDRERWPLAGDQIYVDLDLSVENLPAGTRLAIGEALVEISEKPHTGCQKFSARFGTAALRFVNVGEGKIRRFRGVNAKVVRSGTFAVGDRITQA
jgi:hypothetical protein